MSRLLHPVRTSLVRTSLVVAALLASACGNDAVTEVVLVTESDLAVPTEIDAVHYEVDATAAEGQVATRDVSLDGEGALAFPLTLAILHGGGPLGPIRITVEGRRNDRMVVDRMIEVSFVAGVSRTIRVDLTADCVGMDCPRDQSCAAGECVPIAIDPPAAVDAGGMVPRVDASTQDAGPTAELDAGPGDAGPPPDAGSMCLEECPQCVADCGGDGCTCSHVCACAWRCPAGTTCSAMKCEGTTQCDITAEPDSVIAVECKKDSQCVIRCGTASSCRVRCREEAHCTLHCDESEDCGYDECSGDTDGDGTTIVCARD
jgi:hypothetical protein